MANDKPFSIGEAFTTRRYFYDVTLRLRGCTNLAIFSSVLAESQEQAAKLAKNMLSNPNSWEVLEARQVTITVKRPGA